jgi:membrane-associated phospholipid phosphatase
LQRHAEAMRVAARVPAFLFAAVAASGLTVDVLKIVFGRTRPRLLFSAGSYGFDWLGWRADYWSFPSGHAATAAALVVALWWLWPRHILFYLALGGMIAASRVITCVHYLSDTVMGAAIAVAVTRALAGAMLHDRPSPAAFRAPQHY